MFFRTNDVKVTDLSKSLKDSVKGPKKKFLLTKVAGGKFETFETSW